MKSKNDKVIACRYCGEDGMFRMVASGSIPSSEDTANQQKSKTAPAGGAGQGAPKGARKKGEDDSTEFYVRVFLHADGKFCPYYRKE